MSYDPIGWMYERGYICFTGHDITPLIKYLVQFNKDRAVGKPPGGYGNGLFRRVFPGELRKSSEDCRKPVTHGNHSKL